MWNHKVTQRRPAFHPLWGEAPPAGLKQVLGVGSVIRVPELVAEGTPRGASSPT